jgi:hypothetical protein
MRNGCAKASFNPFLSTFLLFFFHWKPARPDALFCSLGLFLRPSLLALRPTAWTGGRRWSSPQRPGRLWAYSGRRRGDGGSTAGCGERSLHTACGAWRTTYFYIISEIPRPKDAQEASILAFYRALGARAERRPPGGFGERAFRVAALRSGLFRCVNHLDRFYDI